MKLGAHMSISGGCHNALSRGNELECTAIQLFTKNASQWAARPIRTEEVQKFADTRLQLGLDPSNIIVHDSYLINLASPDDTLWEKSLEAFGHELDRCESFGIEALVTHAGAHMGSGEEAGLERIAQGIEKVLAMRSGQNVRVLLETTAGQGTALCYCFEHLGRVIGLLDAAYRDRVGVCWDTCHLFASGLQFGDEYNYEQMVELFDHLVGLHKLKAIHLNDSKKGLGSRVDRHEHIGQGMLGIEPFRLIMNDERLRDVPKVIETPKEAAPKVKGGPAKSAKELEAEAKDTDRRNLDLLRSLVRQAS